MSIEFDAWVLSRLLTGQSLNGERETISEAFRLLAQRLDSLPLGERQGAWESYLDWQTDQATLITALADADPTGPAPEAEATPPRRPRVKLTRASDIKEQAVEWLWTDRVPLGMLTMFAGDPKLGKSFVTMWLAAQVTRGIQPGPTDAPAEPASVILLSAEDDPSRTIVPRLRAAGADLERVHILESVYLSDGAEALPSLRADMDAIEEALVKVGDCRLIIIDPISAYLGGADDHKNAELRGVLSPLKTMAERHDIAIALVSHMNKGNGTNAKYRVCGSIAYVGACRANFLFARDRDDPTGRRVFMLSNGFNIGPDPATLAYRITDDGDGPVVAWEPDPVDITAEDALSDPGRDAEAAERSECVQWLRDLLADGPVPQTEVMSAAKDAGFSKHQIDHAKGKIGATSKREGFGPGSKCFWKIPGGKSSPPDQSPVSD